ncbi:pyridine nucleotide-disulfide oxidoreductase/dicluster-binding protein [Desulfatitalea alkaliphila]|uniref:4Fe-4S dicluster domain-containing protein n=1 Tax=Desulfatitalea alkaliphila TaxID=2929485 RepID=A0AA41R1C8_9BACT|nr:pyridine nucleotide-disulfide oxidoreductase/dicluster-binding protein [Desulfatitalea alkaliphila]MCJ8499420.1 4Fe-4S dicluster domain-containing protein [Desulfatitalea alkaliphila]
MDQRELRQWEARCIQEEPSECTAACPLHLDVRGLIGHLRAGNWNAGWQLLHRALPLAGLLARVCDAPCEAHCKRNPLGGAIRIGALERACATQADNTYPAPPALPRKGKRVAVLGDDWSALAAAWDLCRKGYAVTLHAPGREPGERLTERHDHRLTPSLLETTLSSMAGWGVTFQTMAADPPRALLEELQQGCDALFVDLAVLPRPALDLESGPDGTAAFAPKAHTTRVPGVFAGGTGSSTILRAAHGRWAATAIDRFLQQVSLTAGREREGPLSTRLHTPVDQVVPAPPVAARDPRQGYDADEAMAESRRCLQCECLACVRVCPYLETFGAYPRKYAREIYNNAAIVMGNHSANRLINACSLCGLCEAVCPEGFAMQTLCLNARQAMVDSGKMPPSAHAFALADMAFSQGDAFFMVRHAPDAAQSTHLLFPGCQLCASAPEQVARLYDHLRAHLAGGVGLALGCCGTPAHWAGRRAERDAVLDRWRGEWAAIGRPRILLACSTCHRMFRDFWPEAPIESLWQTLAALPEPAASCPPGGGPLAIHDPCTTRDQPAVQQAVRGLLAALGVAITELPLSGALTECCGFGGLMDNANPAIARTVTERRAAMSEQDYLAYCAMCRDRLAAVGKRSLHLLDLFFPDGTDAAARPRPGWSRRRENRARLKADLLERLWGETPPADPPHRRIPLTMAPAVQATLEERRILIDEVQQVIARAATDGPWFRHPKDGRLLTAARLGHATYWVSYARRDQGHAVFGAYSHRMVVADVAAATSQGTPADIPMEGMDWRCAACDTPLAAGEVTVEYLDNRFTTRMPSCLHCGRALVSETLALGKMAEVESILEDK